MDFRECIARRAALELHDGEYVNLGFGIPTAIANFIPPGIEVILQTENGCLAFGGTPYVGKEDSDVANAGGQPITLVKGSAVFDSTVAFAMIRGGHMDSAFLGALEVDQEGNIANWALPLAPGRYSPGPGGAVDLVAGTPKVVALLQHANKSGESKIKRHCTLPVTGTGVVKVIITDQAVFYVEKDGLVLKEIIAGETVEDIEKITEASFTVAEDICEYRLS
ncbi:MAG: 3-oxoacid CoA-transferase subunit B [Megasphaera cerevisiae]|jgi:3-oxoacid CoA-transferase B subunit|nr:3-oxoacid CoA-transferase subunit B [Megasphaera cerevisiae]